MKRFQWAVPLALFLAIAVSSATWGIQGYPGPSEMLLVSSTSVNLNHNLCRPGGGSTNERQALIMILNNQIYYRFDTATPGNTNFLGNPGDVITTDHPSDMRFIRATATDARIMATCFQ